MWDRFPCGLKYGIITGGRTISTGFKTITLSSDFGFLTVRCLSNTFWEDEEVGVFFSITGKDEFERGLAAFFSGAESFVWLVVFREVLAITLGTEGSESLLLGFISRSRNSWILDCIAASFVTGFVGITFCFFFFSLLDGFANSIPSSNPFAAARAKTSFTDTVSDGSFCKLKEHHIKQLKE